MTDGRSNQDLFDSTPFNKDNDNDLWQFQWWRRMAIYLDSAEAKASGGNKEENITAKNIIVKSVIDIW